MIINHLRNFYGINSIDGLKEIEESKHTMIYAPNGVMKTSITKSFEDLSNGIIPKDQIRNIGSEFEIKLGNSVYDNTSVNENYKPNVVTYSSENKSRFPSRGSKRIPASSQVIRNELEKLENEADEAILEFYTVVYNEVFSRKSKSNEQFINDLLEIDSKDDLSLISIIEKKMDTIVLTGESNYSYLKFAKENAAELFNDSIRKIVESKEFIESIEAYNQVISKSLDDELRKIISEEFTFSELSKLNAQLSKNGYFDIGHQLLLDNVPYNHEELNSLIKLLEQKVYGSPQVRDKFEIIQNQLAGNKASRSLAELIKDNKGIVSVLSEYSSFEELFKVYINQLCITAQHEIQERAIKIKRNLDALEEIMAKDIGNWQKVVNKFNILYENMPYRVIIGEENDERLGVKYPILTKVVKSTNENINDEIEGIFSTGERRSLYILDLMVEVIEAKDINERNQVQDPVLVVLDDVAESFDYKNKYAVIELILDLMEDTNLRMLILTHNFDFFRSVSLKTESCKIKKLMAYRSNLDDDLGNDIKLFKCKQGLLTGHDVFNEWKKHQNELSKIALIPMVRNLIQFKNGKTDNDYLIMTGYLHYNSESKNLTTEEYARILSNLGSTGIERLKGENGCFLNYIELLKKISLKCIQSEVVETELIKKIAMSVAMRIFTDFFLYNKYKLEFNKEPEDIVSRDGPDRRSGNRNWFIELRREGKLSDYEISTISSAFLIAPSFVHLNGFMVEPLVDVNARTMKKNLNDLFEINKFAST